MGNKMCVLVSINSVRTNFVVDSMHNIILSNEKEIDNELLTEANVASKDKATYIAEQLYGL